MWFVYLLLFLSGLGAFGGGAVGIYIGYQEGDLRFSLFGGALAIVGIMLLIASLIVNRQSQENTSHHTGAALVTIFGLAVGTVVSMAVSAYTFFEGRLLWGGGSLLTALLLVEVARRRIDAIYHTVPEGASSTDTKKSNSKRTVQTADGHITKLSKEETLMLVTLRRLHQQERLKVMVEAKESGNIYGVYLDGKPLVQMPKPTNNHASP